MGLCYYYFSPLFSKRSKECFCVDKRHMKMGPGDKTGFPISRSWMGKPRDAPCLTKPECEAQIVPLFIIKMCGARASNHLSHSPVSYKRHLKEIDVMFANRIPALGQRPGDGWRLGGTRRSCTRRLCPTYFPPPLPFSQNTFACTLHVHGVYKFL